ncbi:aspartate carbamoyltransferase [Patescibacteria group bacterium]
MKHFNKQFKGTFKNKSFVSINQLTSKKEVNIILKTADKMKKLVNKRQVNGVLKGYCVAELFYQPSTRTFTSFLGAANWLGALAIPIHGMSAYSSAVKGESLADSIRSIYQTSAADLIILRHPDDNSSEIAAKNSYVPVINAGSGKKEHPTQAILDLYTIRQELGKVENLKVAMVGDLKNGRTIKSLSLLLSMINKNNKMFFVSPDNLRAPMMLLNQLKSAGVEVFETDKLSDVISKVDVLYVTRIQKEWFANEEEYNAVSGSFIIDKKTIKQAKKKMIIMHPLPRVNEIACDVDDDPRAAYFRQMRSGLYTRMALLKLILLGN